MSGRYLSCNGLGVSPARMILALLNPTPKVPAGFPLDERNALFTYQGRYAVSLVCRALKIGPGDEVLVPSYNCGAEVDPYLWHGAKAVFYRVDIGAKADVEDIKRRVTPATRLVHVTHFFGWPQEIGDLGRWCRDKGLFLLEDCAHALFSTGGGDTAIGKIGHAAFYSFVKSLPMPDGGALVVNNRDLIIAGHTVARSPLLYNVLLASLPLLKKWVMHKNAFWQRHECTRRLLTRSWLKKTIGPECDVEPEMPVSNYFDGKKIDWTMSRLSRGILGRTEPARIVEIRRRNYLHLHNALSGIPAVKRLYESLPDAVCPLAFPVFVEDRRRWCAELEGRGILVGGWPSYHRGFDWAEFPEARYLKNNLLTLPVHQDLGADHMEYIAECVRSAAA